MAKETTWDYGIAGKYAVKASLYCAVIYLYDQSFPNFVAAIGSLPPAIGKKKFLTTSTVQKEDYIELIFIFEF